MELTDEIIERNGFKKVNNIFKGGEHGLEDGYVILSISKI